MKIAILICDHFLGDWLVHVQKITQSQLLDVYVLKSKQDNFFFRFLYAIDNKIFGLPNTIKNAPQQFKVYSLTETDCNSDWSKYDVILNFTETKINFKNETAVLNFAISNTRRLKFAVFYFTVCDYKKVDLLIFSKNKRLGSSVRFNPFSFSRNTDLVLHSFLSLLKIYFDKNDQRLEEPYFWNERKTMRISNKQYFIFFTRYLKKTIHHFYYNEQWILGYDFSKNPEIGIDFKNIKTIFPPKDRFWADPIVVFDNGKYYVFIEELIFKNKKGHLSAFELNEDGTYSKPVKILEKPYHLSYPFIFKYEGQYYMIPETAEGNNIQMYESTSFPYKWKLKKILINNVHASDTTVLFHNDRWWLFTSIKDFEFSMSDNNLWVYYTDDILKGTWEPHENNPVSNSITNSRQAGAFIELGSDIFRVAQNCSTYYGYGFMVNRIKFLTPSVYEEELEYSFIPDLDTNKKINGIHTYNHLINNVKVFDILMKKRMF